MQIQFFVSDEIFQKLCKAAAERGYQSALGYARSIVEAAVGVVDFNPLSATTHPLFSEREGTILRGLVDRPRTIPEIAREAGKWYNSLQPVAKMLLERGWIIEADSVTTRGRPAAVYQLTEAGRARLEHEKERRAKLAARADRLAELQSAEISKAVPQPVRLVAQDTSTPKGRYTGALLDAFYRFNPGASEETTLDACSKALAMAEVGVTEKYWTWEDKILDLEALTAETAAELFGNPKAGG